MDSNFGNTLMKYLSDVRVVIAIAVVVVVIIILLIARRLHTNSYHRQLEALEDRYNAIKSVPISFKLNKAVAISRVEPSAMDKVASMRDDFDKCQSNLTQIAQTLADTEDEILAGKLKKAKLDISDLEASIELGEKQVKSLDTFLDSILEKETAQREEVTALKDKFRRLKEQAGENQTQLSYIWTSIQQNVSEAEKMFSAFEEWMYANEYEKAQEELVNIQNSLAHLENVINEFPNLLNDARGVVPKMAEVLRSDYAKARDKGVYLEHLKIEENLNVITTGLNQDLENLKEGNPEGVAEHLNDYKERISQMARALKQEIDDEAELKKLASDTYALYQETSRNSQYVQEQYQRLSSRMGMSDMEPAIKTATSDLTKISKTMPQVYGSYKARETPASAILADMKVLASNISNANDNFKAIRSSIESLVSDEDRARKQLIAMQVVMNQMQMKIRKYKLPSISKQYEADINKANEYMHTLDRLLNEKQLNMSLVNSTLKEAIEFVYTLLDKVNQLVATVIMFENTMVFANRYRSTYADIDSDLTRAELSFRNGEYQDALRTAIGTIEKIYPGNYEKMIKENAKSAA
jgi:septation ring formation regulator